MLGAFCVQDVKETSTIRGLSDVEGHGGGVLPPQGIDGEAMVDQCKGIRDILVRIRIRGSVLMTNGSGVKDA